ncbi:MAG: hypothetical protein BroJett025_02490 [Patescibacteria group bacterium]|nr:MAG: hypothetical protein BroJett025_02490 [Patescibacteria group bacterium]
MIHAESSDKIKNQEYQENVVSKVYGFGSPVTTEPKVDIATANSETPVEHKKRELKEHVFHWWHKTAIVLLALHSIYDLWKGISFLAFEYPEINHLFEQHLVQASEINSLLGEAIVDFAAASIAIFFTVRLVKVKETTEENIDLIASTLLILSTNAIQNFFIRLDFLNLILYTFAQ